MFSFPSRVLCVRDRCLQRSVGCPYDQYDYGMIAVFHAETMIENERWYPWLLSAGLTQPKVSVLADRSI